MSGDNYIMDKETKSTQEDININEVLDKLLKLKEGEKSPSFLKKLIYLIAGVSVLMFVALLCICIYKNNFSSESILATMLAFFSIFISIFFYFKADETSNRFYDSSYKFMKDISVTLGKIEERFAEKLNSLNDKVSHLDKISSEASEEIKDKKDDKDSIINDLMDKANLNEEQKARYRSELEQKDAEIEMLRQNKYRAEREARRLRKEMDAIQDGDEVIEVPSKKFLINLLEKRDASELPIKTKLRLRRLGLMDEEGNLNRIGIIEMIGRVS